MAFDGLNMDNILVSDVLDSSLAPIFHFERFNKLQSILLDQLLETNENIVVGAPTGSGKTVVHELAILRLLQLRLSPESSMKLSSIKAVMIAPNKALCKQRVLDWSHSFGSDAVGLRVEELTGDSESKHETNKVLARANIIVTTPEKWDSVTRQWRQDVMLLGCVDLLLIDEVHHLGDDRGAALEVAVVRTKTVNDTYAKNNKLMASKRNGLRMVALSATLPNLADIGVWLGCAPTGIHYFDESFRPVPITTHVQVFGSEGKSTFLFEQGLDRQVKGVIEQFSEGKQTLVFCGSKKSTETLAKTLGSSGLYHSSTLQNVPTAIINTIGNPVLRGVVQQGVAFHHAALATQDREIIEQLFSNGVVKVLLCTTTLMLGMNLPAHLVVVKGTNQWKGSSSGYTPLPRSTVLQMIGRAGRPGLDTQGVAVIMTSFEQQHLYEDGCLDADVVESSLLSRLPESLCSEISQAVIVDIDSALEWLKKTFFFARIFKNPAFYGIHEKFTDHGDFEDYLTDTCTTALKDLCKRGLVNATHDSACTVTALPETLIMTKHVIRAQTMTALMGMSATIDLAGALQGLSSVQELHTPIARGEKKILNDLAKKCRFRPKGKVCTLNWSFHQCADSLFL